MKVDVLEKYNLDPKFGYGGVSDSFLEARISLIERLEDVTYILDLWDVIGCPCGGYNGFWDDILEMVISDLQSDDPQGIFVNNKEYTKEIEIINYMLCSAEICDYGSSPRFPWLTDYGKVVLELYNGRKK